jgi:uncharacterized protein YbaP (TraB family)
MKEYASRFLQCLASASLLAAVPSVAQTAATPAPAAATTDADPALWVVRDADTTIYLFGTVHALQPNLTWFDEAIAEAFAASSELRIEALVPENPAELGAVVIPLATNSPGTLTSRMAEAQRNDYTRLAEQAGLPWQQLEQFEGWFVGLQLAQGLLQRSGMNPENGADNVLRAAATRRGITISAFETAEEQIRMLDSVPESEQVLGIVEMLRDLPAATALLGRISAAWTAGDPQTTGDIITTTRTMAPEMHRIIFIDRNRRWAENIAERMAQPGTVFVAVGAGHLAGEGSVQDFLTQRGLTVTRINY